MDLSQVDWRKSTHSGMGGCIEVAMLGDRVAVRDSKNPHGPILEFSRTEWTAFLKGVHDGEFNA